MDDREARRAEREAREDVARHPERPRQRDDALARYLGGAFYREQRAHREPTPPRRPPETEDEGG